MTRYEAQMKVIETMERTARKAFLKMDSLIENARRMREQLMEMTDTERLNKLESFMRKSSSNGIAMMPLNGGRLFSIDDLAHEDGSNLGEEYCIGETLRDAIDALNLDDAY